MALSTSYFTTVANICYPRVCVCGFFYTASLASVNFISLDEDACSWVSVALVCMTVVVSARQLLLLMLLLLLLLLCPETIVSVMFVHTLNTLTRVASTWIAPTPSHVSLASGPRTETDCGNYSFTSIWRSGSVFAPSSVPRANNTCLYTTPWM